MVPTMLLGLLLSLSVFSASALRGADLFRADQEHARKVLSKGGTTTDVSKNDAGGNKKDEGGNKTDAGGNKMDDDDDPFGRINVTCPEGYYFNSSYSHNFSGWTDDWGGGGGKWRMPSFPSFPPGFEFPPGSSVEDWDWDWDWNFPPGQNWDDWKDSEHYHPPGYYYESPPMDFQPYDSPPVDSPPDDTPGGGFPPYDSPPLDGGFPPYISPPYQATPYEAPTPYQNGNFPPSNSPPGESPPYDDFPAPHYQGPPVGAVPPYPMDTPPGDGEEYPPGYHKEEYPPGSYPPYAYPPYSEEWMEQVEEFFDSVCHSCPVGFTSPKGSVGSAACTRCPEGYSTIGGGPCLEEILIDLSATPLDEKIQREVIFRFIGIDYSTLMSEPAAYIQEFNDTITIKMLAESIATSARLAQWYPGSMVTVNRLSYPEGTSTEDMDGDAGALVANAGSVLSGLERFGVTGVEASRMMPAPPPSLEGGDSNNNEGDDSKTALIIGVAAGVGGGILLVGLIVLVVIISRRKSAVAPQGQRKNEKNEITESAVATERTEVTAFEDSRPDQRA